MTQYLLRVAKRLAVFLPGVVIAVFLVRNIFPYFDRQLPLGVAVLLTYVLGAYVLVPAVIRLFRIIFPAKHTPLYCVTPDGFASDPLNVGVIATMQQLVDAMKEAGWFVADRRGLRNVVRQALSAVYGWTYPNAPVSSLYLFGRKQDLAFEVPVAGSADQRHHVRFWATTFEPDKPLGFHSIHWHHRRLHVQDDRLLWVGAASLDTGLGYIRHNLQLTHMIDPDTNKERELIVKQLRDLGLAAKVETVKLGEPYRLINRVIRGSLHTDGRMAIVTLPEKPRK